MAGIAVILSIVLGFGFTELTGWLVGGLVSAGYLALYLDQPLRILATWASAVISLLVVRGLSQVTILFGRRRFMACILAGIAASALIDMLTGSAMPAGMDFRAIGYVVPGLIANDMGKQGAGKTLVANFSVTLAVRVCLLLLQ